MTLALYNQDAQTKISPDASAYGLGAVLLQRQDEVWKPVACASKSMTETERRYSQIEKEAFVMVWACERFEDYVLGKEIQLETDHKPLVPQLGKAHLDLLATHEPSLSLAPVRFSYVIQHAPQIRSFTLLMHYHVPRFPHLETLRPN